MTLDDFLVFEIDLGVDAEAADDPGDRVPRHFDELAGLPLGFAGLRHDGGHRRYCSPPRGLCRSENEARRDLPGAACPGDQFGARMAPPRFLVEGAGRDTPQATNHASVQTRCRARKLAARWLIHEGHELVGESRHRAPDADAADVRATTDSIDPPALGHVALHDRAPTAKLDNAFR